MTVFLTLQLIAHLITDFYLQSDSNVAEKNEFGIRSRFLYVHVFIAFATSWLFSLKMDFAIYAGVIAVFHFLIDLGKIGLNKSVKFNKYGFFIDQLLHVLVLAIVSYVYLTKCSSKIFMEFEVQRDLILYVAGYLFCLKPSNIIIRQILLFNKINDMTSDDLERAGRLIGSLERLLALTFVINSQYEALGFLIAAKSILRFKDDDPKKTEYVLIGTMLSFGIAIGVGLLLNFLK